MWEHEKLATYQKALGVAIALHRLAGDVPDPLADLRDQLRRASSSIVLNLAEGANEYSPAEKMRFYRMSRRSAAECAAVLDLLEGLRAPISGAEPAKAALSEVCAMLTRLIQAQPIRR